MRYKILAINLIIPGLLLVGAGEQSLSANVKGEILENYTWEEEEWPDEFHKLLLFIRNQPRNPHIYRTKRSALLAVSPQQFSSSSSILDEPTRRELTLITKKTPNGSSLANIVNSTSTEFGEVVISSMLANPSFDLASIRARQSIIRYLAANPRLRGQITSLLEELARHQHYILAFFGRDSLSGLIHRYYFQTKELEWLNAWPSVIGTSARFSELLRKVDTVSVGFAITALMLASYGPSGEFLTRFADRFKDGAGQKIMRPFRFFGFFYPLFFRSYELGETWTSYLSNTVNLLGASYAGLTLKESYQWDQDQVLLTELIYERINHVHNFLRAYENLAKILNDSEKEKKLGQLICTTWNKGGVTAALSGNFQSKNPAILPVGASLVAYHKLSNDLGSLKEVLVSVGKIDSLVAVANLIDSPSGNNNEYTFASFLESSIPEIEAEGLWNPMVGQSNAVANDIHIGGQKFQKNLLIMGPNAAGKSTFLRAVAFNIVLAQSFGIAAANKFHFTPFYELISTMDISDDPDSGLSRFRNEVKKTVSLFQRANNHPSDEFVLSIMDEVFGSTSPVEGQAAAYSLANQLGSLENTMSLLVSHYSIFQEKDMAHYEKFHTTVRKDANGNVWFPFTIEPGLIYQNIAFDLLIQGGMESSIVSEARDIVDKQ